MIEMHSTSVGVKQVFVDPRRMLAREGMWFTHRASSQTESVVWAQLLHSHIRVDKDLEFANRHSSGEDGAALLVVGWAMLDVGTRDLLAKNV